MKLPAAGVRWEPGRDNDRNRLLEQADRMNHKRGRDIEVSPGRLVISSPDGTRWSITVADDGTVAAEAL
jgi:hypothetical protein